MGCKRKPPLTPGMTVEVEHLNDWGVVEHVSLDGLMVRYRSHEDNELKRAATVHAQPIPSKEEQAASLEEVRSAWTETDIEVRERWCASPVEFETHKPVFSGRRQ